MIVARNIFKYYSQTAVLNNISFTLASGTILGIIGANGAGKSSLFDIIATLDRSFSGEVEVMGFDVKKDAPKIHKIIGYVPGIFSLYDHLTVKENILFFANMYGCNGDYAFSENNVLWPSLKNFSNTLTKNLSGGMKQKLAILCAIVHDPKLLILDEPTIGIDPSTRADLWKEFVNLRNNGLSIIVSTHYSEEIEYMDKLLFLHEGNQLLYDSPSNIVGEYRKNILKITGNKPYIIYRGLKSKLGDNFSYISEGSVRVVSDKLIEHKVIMLLKELGLSNCNVQQVSPNIEDVFINFLLKYRGTIING